MVSADLSAAQHFRRDLPEEEISQCVQNTFPMFPLLNKGFEEAYSMVKM